MLFKNFMSDPLYNKSLKYWYDEWLISSNEIKNGSIGIDIVNIRIILLDIIKEYELNQFESDNNRKVYLSIVQNLIKEQHILKLYRSSLLILREKLEQSDIQAVYIVSKELSEKISKENFAQAIFDELFLIIKKNSFQKKDRSKIKSLTKDIIIELVTSGKDIEDIKHLLKNVLTTYDTRDGETIIFFEHTPPDLTVSQAIEYIDGLSLENRLEIFRENLNSVLSDYIFIFPVWGMIAPQFKNIMIFDLELYNPLYKKNNINNNFLDETFNINLDEDSSTDTSSKCNVKIIVQAISANAGKKIAEEKYSIFLKFANLNFGNKHREFFWDGQYIGEKNNNESKAFGTLFGSDIEKINLRRNISRNSPVYLNDQKYEQMNKYSKVIDILQSKDLLVELNTIVSVIELISKSIWESDENRLLNYWICLESLANISKKNKESKFNFIKETISNIYFLWEKFRPLHNLFSLTNYYSIHDKQTTTIPNDFLKDVGIFDSRTEGSNIPLVKFKKRMEELLIYTTNENFIDAIEDTIEFYKNNQIVLKRLRNKKKEVKLTIDYIYKSRNQIVHNGYVEKNLIPYLVTDAEAYANSLFNRIIHTYLNNEFDLQSYFIKEQYEGDLLEKKLSNNEAFIINFEE